MSTTTQLPPFEDVPANVQRAFLRGEAAAREFAAQTALYKFTQYAQLNGRVSPWWSGVEPLAPGDPGLALTLERAARLGQAAKDFVRARSAVTNQWNSMDGLLVVRLSRPVWGYVGRCAHQPLDEDPAMRNVVWIGGGWQVYFPQISQSDLAAC